MIAAHGGSARGGKFLAEKAVSLDGLLPSTVSVLRAMEGLANTRGECSPSMRDLSHATGFSQNSIRKALEKLKRAGRLTITPQFGEDGGRNANRYTLRLASGKHA